MNDMEKDIIILVGEAREELKVFAEKLLALKGHDFLKGGADEKADVGEMIANIMLTYRHIEDARMRLGKVIQAREGGESVYDKSKPDDDQGEGEVIEKKDTATYGKLGDGPQGANPVDKSRNEGEKSV